MGWLSKKLLKVAVVDVVAGMLFGYVVGYIAVYTTLNIENLNCENFKTRTACNSVKFTTCRWDSAIEECTFTFDCSASRSLNECKLHTDKCFWDYDKDECKHYLGMSPVLLGIFAGSMVVGGTIGSTVAGPLTFKYGHKKVLFAVGVINLIGAILLHIARGFDVYALHVIGRFLSGIASGICCVTAPMYVNEMAPPGSEGVIGCLYQCCITFGIFICAVVGIIIEPHNFHVKQINEFRIHFVLIIQHVTSLLVIAVSLLISESTKWRAVKQREAEGVVDKIVEGQDPTVYPLRKIVRPLLTSVILSLGLQMTGINSISNYAPQITKALGLRPMLGNLVIAIWNWFSTFFAFYFAARFNLNLMMLGGIFFTVIGNLVTGIPTYPGVANNNVRLGVGLLGVFFFIFAFEAGVGPPYYVLVQDVFPHTFRPKGVAFANSVQFTFNIIINVFFPICVRAFSGGAAGNQNQGLAIVFFCFAAFGAISFAYLLKFMKPFYANNSYTLESNTSMDETPVKFEEE